MQVFECSVTYSVVKRINRRYVTHYSGVYYKTYNKGSGLHSNNMIIEEVKVIIVITIKYTYNS